MKYDTNISQEEKDEAYEAYGKYVVGDDSVVSTSDGDKFREVLDRVGASAGHKHRDRYILQIYFQIYLEYIYI